MKKLFLMLALFSAVVVSANAQIATENSNALDNISVGINAGASVPLVSVVGWLRQAVRQSCPSAAHRGSHRPHRAVARSGVFVAADDAVPRGRLCAAAM